MRILLIGKNGQLGCELHRTLQPLGILVAVDFPEIDLGDPSGVRRYVREAQPDVIVNAAAYTAVDRAESEPDLAMAVNAVAPGVLAEEAREIGAALIHFSTDYVFDGRKGEPYVETDTPNPLNVYGESKLAGEHAIQAAHAAYLILRTSWVYSLRRESFVTKVLHWAREKETLRIVTDQVGSPTWARSLAEVSAKVLTAGNKDDMYHWLRPREGIYHLGGSGAANRYEWAQAILEFDPHPEEQKRCELVPASSAEFPAAAMRPAFSALDCGRFASVFGLSLPRWRESLQLALSTVTEKN